MRIQITKPGLFNSAGEPIEVGTELTVKGEPTAWKGRYEVLRGSGEGKTAVVNPKPPEDPAKAELEAMKVDDLKKLADDEKVDLGTASAKGDMIAAILKARAAKA